MGELLNQPNLDYREPLFEIENIHLVLDKTL